MGDLVVNMMKSPWKLRQKTGLEFPNGGKAFVEQILASEERNSKKSDCEWDPSRKIDHLSKVIGDGKIVTEFTRSISSTRIG